MSVQARGRPSCPASCFGRPCEWHAANLAAVAQRWRGVRRASRRHGLILLTQKDGVSLAVTLGGPENSRRSTVSNQAAADRFLPKGLTLSGRF
jgi:hypothetical protein